MPGRCANGHEVAAGNRFCTRCGLSMPAICPNGHDVDAAHLYNLAMPRPLNLSGRPSLHLAVSDEVVRVLAVGHLQEAACAEK